MTPGPTRLTARETSFLDALRGSPAVRRAQWGLALAALVVPLWDAALWRALAPDGVPFPAFAPAPAARWTYGLATLAFYGVLAWWLDGGALRASAVPPDPGTLTRRGLYRAEGGVVGRAVRLYRSLDGREVLVPLHWRRYLRPGTDRLSATAVLTSPGIGHAPTPRAVGISRETPPLALRLDPEIALGHGRLLWVSPGRGLAMVWALAVVRLGAASAGGWGRMGAGGAGLALATACAAFVLVVLWVQHRGALGRIRSHYRESQGAEPLPVWARIPGRRDGPPAPPAAPPRRVAPEAATPVPTETDRPQPACRIALEIALEWNTQATCAPGLPRLRVSVEGASAHAEVAVRLADESGAPVDEAREVSLPALSTMSIPVRVPAQAGAGVVAVATLTDGAHRETARSAVLPVLGPAAFWVGPRWDVERCHEGDAVPFGGAVDGLPPGARVQATVEARAWGPTAGPDRQRTVEVATLAGALDDDGAFLLRWTAARAVSLHDGAAYAGWSEPAYQVRVEVLGLVGVTGDLRVDE